MHGNLVIEQVLTKIEKVKYFYPQLAKITLTDEESYVIEMLEHVMPEISDMEEQMLVNREVLEKLVEWDQLEIGLLEMFAKDKVVGNYVKSSTEVNEWIYLVGELRRNYKTSNIRILSSASRP